MTLTSTRELMLAAATDGTGDWRIQRHPHGDDRGARECRQHGPCGCLRSRAAISAGMTKINVPTRLNGFFTAAIRDYLDANPTVVDSRKHFAAGRAALTGEAARMLQLFRSQRR